MDTIMSYLENMFAQFPDTEDVRKVKADMAAMMEDKYTELKAAGISENEAVGTVISEFGNIEELAREMGFDRRGEAVSKPEEKWCRRVSLSEAREYIETSVEIGKKIAKGVFLCICSPIALIILSAIAEDGLYISEKIADLIGVLFMFSMVAVAVVIFIIYGVRLSKFEDLEKDVFQLEPGVEKTLISMREAGTKSFGVRIATGVGLCIVSLIPLLVVDTFFPDTEIPTGICTGLMLFLVAIAVYIFVSTGMPHERYSILLQEGEYAKERKENKTIELIAGIYWPVITAIYLAYSFTTADWGRSWIIWPVAGVLFAAVAGVCNLAKK